jgi:hypothetical protein
MTLSMARLLAEVVVGDDGSEVLAIGLNGLFVFVFSGKASALGP